jgi:uncharacterized protein
MILPDANLLLYAYNVNAPQHVTAKTWLEDILSGTEVVGLAWLTIIAFIRISTNSKAFPSPISIEQATSIVELWLTRPIVTVIAPTERHWSILKELLTDGQVKGPLVTDAHLAALAIEHGAVLYTSDRDFARFSNLRVTNPL